MMMNETESSDGGNEASVSGVIQRETITSYKFLSFEVGARDVIQGVRINEQNNTTYNYNVTLSVKRLVEF